MTHKNLERYRGIRGADSARLFGTTLSIIGLTHRMVDPNAGKQLRHHIYGV